MGPSEALRLIRAACVTLGLPVFRWHDLRRGMAQDLLAGGGSISHILYAGGWRSGAFLRYLSRKDLNSRALLEQALLNSDSE